MKVKEEIVKFLEEFKGYQKCSPSKIQKVLEKKDLYFTEEECKEALHFIKYNKKEIGSFTFNDNTTSTARFVINSPKENIQEIPEGFEIKSKWQNASGEWLMSLKPTVEAEQGIVPEDYYAVFQDIISEELICTESITKNTLRANKKDLKVWTSDKHIGAIGSDGNEYSAEEFESRMDKLFDHIMYLVKENGVFETITITDLGDAIDGMDGFTVSRTHRLPQNLDNKQMFEVYFRVHKKFFDKLFASGAAKKYQIWDITVSNHGGDFEHVSKMALLAYIEGVYPEVKIEVLDKFLNLVEHEGIHYILTHGKDATNRKFGLPLYPDPKTESLIEAYLKRMDVPRKANIRLVKGDLHMSSSSPCKNIDRYKTVSSMFGSSQWVLDNFELTDAGVDYEIMDLNTGVISESVLKF